MESKEEKLIEAIQTDDQYSGLVLINDPQVNLNYKNKQGNTPLYLATMNGNAFLVDMLIKKGADVNIPNNVGWTPLNVAAHNSKYPDVFQLLINNYAKYGKGPTRGGRKRNKKSKKRRKTIRKKRKTFKRK